MSASMCASAPSLLAPDTPCRTRYPDACSGFTPYTVYPAATSAATHGPRSVSVPVTTSASSASSPRYCPIRACSRAIPATPSGSRFLARTRPSAAARPQILPDQGVHPAHPRHALRQPLPGQHPPGLVHQLHIVMILSPVIAHEQPHPLSRPRCRKLGSSLRENNQRPNETVLTPSARTTSQQRSTLPAAGRGTIFREGSRPWGGKCSTAGK